MTAQDVHEAEVRVQTFRRHAHRLGWDHRRRGTWTPAGVALDHRQRAREAISGLSGDVLITGRSALLLYGVVNEAGPDVELLLPAPQHLTTQAGVCAHRTRVFDDIRYQHRDDFRAAAVPRALADCAVHATVNELCRDIASAVRQRQCLLSAIATELAARKRFPGRGRLRRAYGMLTGELTHSADEGLSRRLLRKANVVPHHQPLAIEADGRLVAEIDLAFVDVLYGVEVDGPHHLLPDVAAADRMRDRSLDDRGWKIDRFFWFELEERPQWFVSEVARRLAERRERSST